MPLLRGLSLNGRPYQITLNPDGSMVAGAYASAFTVSASSTMTVGVASPVTVGPVGGVWHAQTVTAAPQGLSGVVAPTSTVAGSGTTPVTFQFTPSTAGQQGSIDATVSGMVSSGAANVTVVAAPAVTPSGPMSQVFTVTNWGSSASLGVYKRGVWFKKGDVPTGQIPALSSGTAQFYGLSRWNDGSLKHARMWMRDLNLATGASRSYTITAAGGSLTGSVKAIGNAGLVAALSGHDFKVTFANAKDSAGSTYGGGSLVASLATHAAIATRWEVLSTGPVADVWQGWGMAGSDAHLKVNWYVTRLKNADGSTLAWRIGAVPSLDWWSVAGKTDLTYDATLADGASAIVSFAGVQHYYHSQWLMCVNDGGLNAGTAPWVGAAQPTLDYTFDKTYAILSGVVHPLRRNKTPQPVTQYAYVPCNVVNGPDSHRTALDAGGGYPGRGPMTRFDCDAFMAQTPQFTAVSRLNALTGLSVTYHFRSNRTRARSGESADLANTNIVPLMAPKASSYSDFTAQGLPIAVNSCRGGSSDGTDGFVTPSSLGSNPWGLGSLDSTHAVSYAYYQQLITGDEWFVEAQLDITLNLYHQEIWGFHQPQSPWSHQYNNAAPTSLYSGLLGQWGDGPSIRYFGWATLVQGHGFGLLPADHQYKPAALALMAHQGDYIQANIDYLPADFQAAGVYFPDTRTLYAEWMAGFGSTGSYFHYALNEDARWQRVADWICNWTISQAEAARWYMWDAFRTITRAGNSNWNATTNPMLPPAQQPFIGLTPDLDSSGTFTQSKTVTWNVLGVNPPPIRNGDVVYFTNCEEGGFYNGVVPAGVTEGTVGYIVNLTNGDHIVGSSISTPYATWQVSATPGGSPMTFGGQVLANINMPVRVASVGEPAYSVASQPGTLYQFPYIFAWGNYIPVNMTALSMARHAGNPRVTTALRDAAIAFIAPAVGTNEQYYYSSYDCVPFV